MIPLSSALFSADDCDFSEMFRRDECWSICDGANCVSRVCAARSSSRWTTWLCEATTSDANVTTAGSKWKARALARKNESIVQVEPPGLRYVSVLCLPCGCRLDRACAPGDGHPHRAPRRWDRVRPASRVRDARPSALGGFGHGSLLGDRQGRGAGATLSA